MPGARSASRPAARELYVGLMSGTSLDGVSAALVDLRHAPRLLATAHLPYPATLRETLIELHSPRPDELHRAALAANALAALYARATLRLLRRAGIAARAVRAIGCHGQTVRHRPREGYTLQLNNPALLAERTGITVVADFRSRDIAAGGEGAPLAPAFHASCLRHPRRHRVIVNIGGIANLTDLAPTGAVRGFDTGPGNLLLDAWAMRHLGRRFDRGGRFAARGRPIEAMLDAMLADPWFRRPPPKSTGRDYFNLAWLERFAPQRHRPADVQATLAELTARSIAAAITRFCAGASEIYLCGGGSHNEDLLERLRRRLPGRSLDRTDVLGAPADWVEAIAFAWLAQRALTGEPANLPAVTGARGPRVLGAIYPA